MFKLLLTLIALAIMAAPTYVEAILDYKDWKRHIADKKGQDVVLRIIAMLAAGFAVAALLDKRPYQGALLSGGIFVISFDYLMGYLLTKRPTFLGTTAKTDKLLKNIKPKWVLVGRGLFFAITVALYFINFK